MKALKPELDKIFKPAFLGRMVIIPYFPIRDEALKKIVRLKLGKIQRRLRETHKHRADLRRRAGRRGGEALHRSGERRAQRRQHPDQFAAAGDLAQAAGAARRGHASRRRFAPASARTAGSPTRTRERLNGRIHAKTKPAAAGSTRPLGDDVLLLENIEGEEAISRPFEYRLDMLSAERLRSRRPT